MEPIYMVDGLSRLIHTSFPDAPDAPSTFPSPAALPERVILRSLADAYDFMNAISTARPDITAATRDVCLCFPHTAAGDAEMSATLFTMALMQAGMEDNLRRSDVVLFPNLERVIACCGNDRQTLQNTIVRLSLVKGTWPRSWRRFVMKQTTTNFLVLMP